MPTSGTSLGQVPKSRREHRLHSHLGFQSEPITVHMYFKPNFLFHRRKKREEKNTRKQENTHGSSRCKGFVYTATGGSVTDNCQLLATVASVSTSSTETCDMAWLIVGKHVFLDVCFPFFGGGCQWLPPQKGSLCFPGSLGD